MLLPFGTGLYCTAGTGLELEAVFLALASTSGVPHHIRLTHFWKSSSNVTSSLKLSLNSHRQSLLLRLLVNRHLLSCASESRWVLAEQWPCQTLVVLWVHGPSVTVKWMSMPFFIHQGVLRVHLSSHPKYLKYTIKKIFF